MLPPFVQGIGIGLAIAAPVGPIAVLCIQRTLARGRRAGLASGLGAATADACYGAIAAFGLVALADPLLRNRSLVSLLGGLFLLFLGLRALRAVPATADPEVGGRGTTLEDFGSTLALTLTNPVTVLAFLGIFAGFGAVVSDPFSAATLVAGVFLGSALWWLLLSTGVARFRERVTHATLVTINRVAGLVLAGFGVVAVAGAV